MLVYTWDSQDVRGDTTLISIQSTFSHPGWEIAIILGPILCQALDGVKCSGAVSAQCNGCPLHSDNVRTITFPLALPLPALVIIHSLPKQSWIPFTVYSQMEFRTQDFYCRTMLIIPSVTSLVNNSQLVWCKLLWCHCG